MKIEKTSEGDWGIGFVISTLGISFLFYKWLFVAWEADEHQ